MGKQASPGSNSTQTSFAWEGQNVKGRATGQPSPQSKYPRLSELQRLDMSTCLPGVLGPYRVVIFIFSTRTRKSTPQGCQEIPCRTAPKVYNQIAREKGGAYLGPHKGFPYRPDPVLSYPCTLLRQTKALTCEWECWSMSGWSQWESNDNGWFSSVHTTLENEV